jgi:drug/metabolite transporter (DMT)-like permease
MTGVYVERRASIIAAIVSAACFGTLAIFTSFAYRADARPLPLLAWRFALAAVLLGGYLLATRPQVLRVPVGDIARYAVLAVAGYGAASICFFFALTYIDASVVAILLYTYPAMVVLAERVAYGIRLTKARWIAVGLTFGGSVLVLDPFGVSDSMSLVGVLLGLGAALGYSVFSMLSQRWGEGRSRAALMTYLFVFTALLASAAALAVGEPLSPESWEPLVWPMLGAIVVLPTFLAIVLYLQAIRGLGASQAALLSTFEPVFTIVLAAVVLGERLVAWQWAGAALVIVGVFVAERAARPPEQMAII